MLISSTMIYGFTISLLNRSYPGSLDVVNGKSLRKG
ncbi:hypothetical protein Goari_011360 [Gossypium aridum]|uniref:Uncharacterized protein n=1 Tax=Gossypium aridum TaxID=34290 RepID=A0A7J8WXJ6_GOSAI|nr:hypothetical protein [Gossypium aridum]